MKQWIFQKDQEHTRRYSLGIHGENMLICCGINPNTAKPGELNNTVRRVENFAKDNGYDGYIVVNIYSQISKDPKDIHLQMDETYHKENINALKEIFELYPKADMWAAWGTTIETRPYFYQALKDIYDVARKHDLNWVHINKLTKAGHPRHPLYLKADSQIFKFDVENYINNYIVK